MEDLLTAALLGSYVLLLALDFFAPARAFPAVRFWRLKGMVAFVMSIGMFMTLPFLWDAWLLPYRLVDATGLGTIGGAVVGLLAMQFVSYWWHRTMHRTPVLWRWFHQMHHSAERVDVFGAFYFHPLDVVGFAFTGSIALTLGIGLSPEAVVIANTIGMFCNFFQHANLRTPQWLGYFIQRPENHAVHHERGVHAFNYGDISFWDIVFGTFRNPKSWHAEAGFYDGASSRMGEVLLGRDVSQPSGVETKAATRDSHPIATTV